MILKSKRDANAVVKEDQAEELSRDKVCTM